MDQDTKGRVELTMPKEDPKYGTVYTTQEVIEAELSKSITLLAKKRLTGDEIKYIRKSIGLNKQQFGEVFGGLSLYTVAAWEIDGLGRNEMVKFARIFTPVVRFYRVYNSVHNSPLPEDAI
jgi:DNA-binding transcriptional regulator YiaG